MSLKKGDLKRVSILETAESLFFKKGYEQTSVQDILDVLGMSKGGFYHHFPSKEAILAEICENRVDARLSRISSELFGVRISPTDRINLLLRMAVMFERDEPEFAALMLKLCWMNGDVRIREHMRSLVYSRLLERVNEAIAEGCASGEFFVRKPGHMGAVILNLVLDLDAESCRMMAADSDRPELVLDMVELLSACRDAVETLLGASYGTIQLYDPARFVAGFRAAAAELRKLEEK